MDPDLLDLLSLQLLDASNFQIDGQWLLLYVVLCASELVFLFGFRYLVELLLENGVLPEHRLDHLVEVVMDPLHRNHLVFFYFCSLKLPDSHHLPLEFDR